MRWIRLPSGDLLNLKDIQYFRIVNSLIEISCYGVSFQLCYSSHEIALDIIFDIFTFIAVENTTFFQIKKEH